MYRGAGCAVQLEIIPASCNLKNPYTASLSLHVGVLYRSPWLSPLSIVIFFPHGCLSLRPLCCVAARTSYAYLLHRQQLPSFLLLPICLEQVREGLDTVCPEHSVQDVFYFSEMFECSLVHGSTKYLHLLQCLPNNRTFTMKKCMWVGSPSTRYQINTPWLPQLPCWRVGDDILTGIKLFHPCRSANKTRR